MKMSLRKMNLGFIIVSVVTVLFWQTDHLCNHIFTTNAIVKPGFICGYYGLTVFMFCFLVVKLWFILIWISKSDGIISVFYKSIMFYIMSLLSPETR